MGKIKIGRILGWFFGAIIIIIGLGSVLSYDFSGIFILLSGLIILPPISSFLKEKFKFNIYTKTILFLILFIFGISFSQPEEINSNQKQTENIQNSIDGTNKNLNFTSKGITQNTITELITSQGTDEGYYYIRGPYKYDVSRSGCEKAIEELYKHEEWYVINDRKDKCSTIALYGDTALHAYIVNLVNKIVKKNHYGEVEEIISLDIERGVYEEIINNYTKSYEKSYEILAEYHDFANVSYNYPTKESIKKNCTELITVEWVYLNNLTPKLLSTYNDSVNLRKYKILKECTNLTFSIKNMNLVLLGENEIKDKSIAKNECYQEQQDKKLVQIEGHLLRLKNNYNSTKTIYEFQLECEKIFIELKTVQEENNLGGIYINENPTQDDIDNFAIEYCQKKRERIILTDEETLQEYLDKRLDELIERLEETKAQVE